MLRNDHGISRTKHHILIRIFSLNKLAVTERNPLLVAASGIDDENLVSRGKRGEPPRHRQGLNDGHWPLEIEDARLHHFTQDENAKAVRRLQDHRDLRILDVLLELLVDPFLDLTQPLGMEQRPARFRMPARRPPGTEP